MTRPRHLRHVVAGALALALLPAFWPTDAAAHTCDAPFSTNLIAGQTIDAGDVKVCNDDTTLTVTYEATFPWCLLKTDLHVATSKSDIPQNKNGHPQPGKFAYGEEYGGCLDGTAIFVIDLADIGGGVEPEDTVFIAAHAEVENEAGRTEGAWGAGTRFVERGPWAMYFTYAVQEPFLCGGDTSKCVFVTSTTHNGNLGGLAGADAICQNLAEADGSSAAAGTYKAWLSTSGADNSAADRLTHATVPYKRVDGTQIAVDWERLVDGSLDAPINGDERGATVGGTVWTGTEASGAHDPANLDCGEWLSDAGRPFAGIFGSSVAVDAEWSREAGVAFQCFVMNRLYCFQQ